jgi:hypothetical protein
MTNMNTYIEEIEKRLQGTEYYPVDVFTPPWDGWQKDVDELAKQHGKRIDNISADYGRRYQKIFSEDAIKVFKELLPSLLSKFAAEINGESVGGSSDYIEGCDAHHRSVAEKAGEIIKTLQS